MILGQQFVHATLPVRPVYKEIVSGHHDDTYPFIFFSRASELECEASTSATPSLAPFNPYALLILLPPCLVHLYSPL